MLISEKEKLAVSRKYKSGIPLKIEFSNKTSHNHK